MTLNDKAALREELVRSLAAILETAQRSHNASVEAATHEEAKPENDKDTRALEQSYLARGQAERLVELKEGILLIQAMPLRTFEPDDSCTLGAVVEVEFDGHKEAFWLAPAGGGTRLAKGTIQVLTPKSPLGRALIGSSVGDQCEAQIGGKLREIEIIGLH